MTVIVKPMENITFGAEVTGIRLADLAPEDWTSIYDAFWSSGCLFSRPTPHRRRTKQLR